MSSCSERLLCCQGKVSKGLINRQPHAQGSGHGDACPAQPSDIPSIHVVHIHTQKINLKILVPPLYY